MHINPIEHNEKTGAIKIKCWIIRFEAFRMHNYIQLLMPIADVWSTINQTAETYIQIT